MSGLLELHPAFFLLPLPCEQVGLELSKAALDIPLPVGGTSNQVSGELGQFLVGAAWIPTKFDSGGEASGDSGCPSLFHVEALVSSAALHMNPGSFRLLHGVHARAIAVVPVRKIGLAVGSDCLESVDSILNSDRDELGDKARGRLGQDDILLPTRPILQADEAFAGARAGVIAPRAQFAVATSGLKFSLATSHVADLSCFVIDALDRVRNTSELLGSVSPPPRSTTHSRPVVLSASEGAAAEVAGSIAPGQLLQPSETALRSNLRINGSASTSSSSSRGVEASADAVQGAAARSGSRWNVVSNDTRPSASESRMGMNVVHSASSSALYPESLDPSREEHSRMGGGVCPPVHPRQLGGRYHVDLRPVVDPVGPHRVQPGGDGGETPELVQGQALGDFGEGLQALMPALLGSIVIEGVSILLLTEQESKAKAERVTTDRTGHVGSRSSSASRVHQHASAVPSLSTSASHYTTPQQCAQETDTVRSFSPLILLELRGIGLGIDLLGPGMVRGEQPMGVERDADEPASQHRVEVAIGRITLVDREPRRRGSLVTILGGATNNAGPAPVVERDNEQREAIPETSHRRASGRILPARWACPAVENHEEVSGGVHGFAGGCSEQVLLRVQLCPASNELSVQADMTSVHLMALPPPILDVLNMASEIEKSITCRILLRENRGLREVDRTTSSANIPPEVAEDNHDLGQNQDAGTSAPLSSRESAAALDGGQQLPLTGRSQEPGRSQGLSSVSQTAGRGGDSREEQDAPIVLGSAGAIGGGERAPDARRTICAVVGSLRRGATWPSHLDLKVTLRDFQLWLPDIAVSAEALESHACRSDSEEHGNTSSIEAIVLSTDSSIHFLATSLLLANPSADFGDASAATPGSVGVVSDIEFVDHGEGRTGSIENSGASAGLTSNDKLCEIGLNLHALEVSVGRLPLVEFCAPVVTCQGEDLRHVGRSQVQLHCSGSSSETGETEGRRVEIRDDPANISAQTGRSPSDVLSCVRRIRPLLAAPSVNLRHGRVEETKTSEPDPSPFAQEGDVGVGSAERQDNWHGHTYTNHKIHRIVLPFNIDISHILWLQQWPTQSTLRSDLEVSVSQIDVRILHDFQLANRVMAGVVVPLTSGLSSPSIAKKRVGMRGDDPIEPEREFSRAGEMALRGNLEREQSSVPGGTSAVRSRFVSSETSRVEGVVPQRVGANTDTGTSASGGHGVSVLAGENSGGATQEAAGLLRASGSMVGEEPPTLKVLAALWEGHVKLNVVGVKLTVKNNLRVQGKRPALSLDVSKPRQSVAR